MANVRIAVSKKGTLIAMIVLVLFLGGGGGYLLWRVNQKDTVAPTDSSASGECVNIGVPIMIPADDDDTPKPHQCQVCLSPGEMYKCGDYSFKVHECGQAYCKEYNVKYVAGPNGTVNDEEKVIFEHVFYQIGTAGPVTAKAKPGYKFTGWSDGRTDNPRTDRNITSRPPNAGYTAVFEELAPVVEEFVTVTYTVNDSNGGEIVGSKTQKIKKGTGSGTQVTAKAKSGYDFTKWSDDNPSSIRTDKNLDKDTTFTAIFTPTRSDAKLRLEYIAGPGGSIMGTKVQTVSKGGNGTPVTAVADNGYVFDGWCEDASMTVCAMAADSGPGRQPGTGGATRVDSNVQANATYWARFRGENGVPVGGSTVPQTGLFDETKNIVIMGVVLLMLGIVWTWVSTLPKKAYTSIKTVSKASSEYISNVKVQKERNIRESRRNRLEKRIK